MSSVRDVSGIPTAGKSLFIVAVVDHVLHFRIFNGDGKVIERTDEKKLSEQARQIEELRKQLESLWPPHRITPAEKDQVIFAVTSIVGQTEVRQVLEEGEKNAPAAAAIYVALASIEQRAKRVDKAIEVLKRGLEHATDQVQLRLIMTDYLAERGDTVELQVQINKLKELGSSPLYLQYYTARYHINANEFLKARQLLLALPRFVQSSGLRFQAKIDTLLALCYRHLGEPGMEQTALARARSADPQNVEAHLEWINNLVRQGDTDGAITEYRSLVNRVPGVELVLARLLIAQNQRRTEAQRKWNEVEELINRSPKSIESVILRAQLLFAQGNPAAAYDALEKARTEFRESVEIGLAQATLMEFQGRVPEALVKIDELKKQLGDSVEVRLARARVLTSKKGPQIVKGPQVIKALVELGEDVEKFAKSDRQKLLTGLTAIELERQNLEQGSRLLTRLAEEDPSNLDFRLALLDLALQLDKENDIKENIEKIKQIEGNDGLQGLHCQVKYLLWQARRTDAKSVKEAIWLQARCDLERIDEAPRRLGLDSLGHGRFGGARAGRSENVRSSSRQHEERRHQGKRSDHHRLLPTGH